MLHAYLYDLQEFLDSGYASAYLIVVLLIFTNMTLRRVCGLIYYFLYNRKLIHNFPETRDFSITAFVTVAGEDPHFFRGAMRELKASLREGSSKHAILVMIDTYDIEDPEANKELARIAFEEGADHVLGGNNQDKRRNIEDLAREADIYGKYYHLIGFVDSDTRIPNGNATLLMARYFADPRTGVVSSCQRIRLHDHSTIPEVSSDQFEFARTCSSMPAGSLVGSLPCAPGRYFLALGSAIKHHLLHDLAREYIQLRIFGYTIFRYRCKAGDDRSITSAALKQRLRTYFEPRALVETLAPRTWSKLFRAWERWASSNEWYISRDWSILRKRPIAFLIPFTDLLMTIGVCFLLLHFPYSFLFGSRHLAWYLALITATGGMLLTTFYGQFPYYLKYPLRIFLMPVFMVEALIGQVIRGEILFRPWMIELWGTRKNVDGNPIPPNVRVIHSRWEYRKYGKPFS